MKKIFLVLLFTFTSLVQAGMSKADEEFWDFKTRYNKNISLAKQGNATAQVEIGTIYNMEQGPKKENQDKKAVFWFRKAANQGNADGQFLLGVKYSLGRGVLQDYKQAVIWYRKAAAQENETAQYFLADMHREGRGVDQDNKQAYMWYNLARANGYDASYWIGQLEKKMSKKDLEEAHEMSKKCLNSNYQNCRSSKQNWIGTFFDEI